ncbi:MAG: MBL fold metallo-hydrolase [Paenibacillaceae bacterium]
MKIQMLGTGSAFAKQYLNTNALIHANGYNMLIDCGSTAMLALHQLNIPLDRIDGVWITHVHADHIGGLEELAFRMKYEFNKKIDLYVAEDMLPTLWENCLKGGLINEREGFVSLEDYYDVNVVNEQQSVKVTDELNIEPIRTVHVPGKPNYSLYINDYFFYSADMQFNPELLDQLHRERGCRLIFHDCQLEPPRNIHTMLEELLTLPIDLQQIIWLMHYNDHVANFHGKTGAMRFLPQHELIDISMMHVRT